MTRKQISSASPYEDIAGFCRAVRVGNIITVAGTGPIAPNGKMVGKGDAAAQARRCFEIAKAAIQELGGTMDDVVRTRLMLTDIRDWEAVAKVHGEVFTGNRPGCTLMQVTSFIDPDWLIEIEVDAVVEE